LLLFGLSYRIEVENLTKYYGILAAIEHVSFTVQEGEILGLLAQQYEITSHGTIVCESEDRTSLGWMSRA